MYLDHFGLRELPFSLTPDTGYFYDRGTYHEALNVLLLAIRSGEGFIKITGEVGTGKTLLCRKLLGLLGESYLTAYLPDPFLHANGLRKALAAELGIPANQTADRQVPSLASRLLELNAAGKRVVFIIDEAQALADDSLEAIRLLSNLETERHKLLQVVLFGQPELDHRLAGPNLRQLRQRITFSYRLQPLQSERAVEYLRHRLHVAGYRGPTPFTPAAARALARASRGIPRLINVLAHKALMAAYGRGSGTITVRHVLQSVRDTEDAGGTLRALPRAVGVAAATAAMALASLGAYLAGVAGG